MPDELIASFDHSTAVGLAEYAAASKALDDLAHALPGDVTRERFVEMAREMAAALIYPDKCAACVLSDGTVRLAAPHVAEVEGQRLRGTYRCATCGARWRCRYSTRLPDLPL